jgi:hypothetical protein
MIAPRSHWTLRILYASNLLLHSRSSSSYIFYLRSRDACIAVLQHTTKSIRVLPMVAMLLPSNNCTYLSYTFVDSSILIRRSATTFDDTGTSSITQSSWSKEAIFGLLGVLVVLIVPCLGFLLRLCVMRLRLSKSPEFLEGRTHNVCDVRHCIDCCSSRKTYR